MIKALCNPAPNGPRCLFVACGLFATGMMGAPLRASTQARSNGLLLTHVHMLDPDQEAVLSGNLLLVDGKIARWMSSLPRGFKGEIRDLSGRFIVPTFADMHVHASRGNPGPGVSQPLSLDEATRRMLYAGVAIGLDLFADEDSIFAFRQRQRQERPVQARLFAAGPMLTAPGGHGTDFEFKARTVASPGQAAAVVKALAVRHPDVIKIALDHTNDLISGRKVRALSPRTAKALLQQAQRLQIPTVVHIGNWEDARVAVQGGATIVTHLFETTIPDDLLSLMKKKRTIEVPTLAYQMDLEKFQKNPGLYDSALLQAVTTPQLLHAYKHFFPYFPQLKPLFEWQRRAAPHFLESVKRLSDAGVPLMAGTDAGDLGTFQGYSLHRELRLMAEAGVPAWEILRSATSRPRQFLHLPLGLRPGERAEFLVLSGSPLSDWQNTEKIEAIWFDGALVDRASLLR